MANIGMIPMSTPEMRIRIDAITLWREDVEEECPTGKPPVVVGDKLKCLGGLIPDRSGGKGSREERGGED